ncbi:MAG: hypothetical protein NTU60_10945 [Candidatus Aminicenantes bacterium]|nr:hypothetical protein [Candidatus Aminicenantes bacterium]
MDGDAGPVVANNPRTISVYLTVKNAGTSSLPFGEFSTPVDGTTGITGAIPVTGWVIDDVEVTRVEVKRDPHSSDPTGAIGPDGLVFIGYGIFVEGARPDIETSYPGFPLNYRAGWGYMLLTNFLPSGGNGTYRLHAFAYDKEGNPTLLGSKSITCDNAHATKPFGTIDTPEQGGDSAGNPYLNFGWVLTPMTKTVPKDGSTIDVFVDSVKVGNLATAPNMYDQYRVDVATAFPGLNNSGGPVGAFFLNTTAYPNGVHTIHWIATDDAGAADGIGSRYFNIVNTGTPIQNGDMYFGDMYLRDTSSRRIGDTRSLGAPDLSAKSQREERSDVAISKIEDILNLPMTFEPLRVKQGFDLKADPVSVAPDNFGVYRVEIPEVNRLEIGVASTIGREKVKNGDATPILSGYMIVGEELRPLPIGSTLDACTGTFSWMPGPGFVGEYKMVFVAKDGFGAMRRIPLNVKIVPKR